MLDHNEVEVHKKARAVFLLNAEQIDVYWPNILEVLKEVPGFFDFYTSEWAYSQAKMGLLQVWALSDGEIRGIVLTRVLEFPAQKTLEVMAICGMSLLEYFDLLDDVFEKVAAGAGCKTISALVRPGVERKLRKHWAQKRAVSVFRPVGLKKEH